MRVEGRTRAHRREVLRPRGRRAWKFVLRSAGSQLRTYVLRFLLGTLGTSGRRDESPYSFTRSAFRLTRRKRERAERLSIAGNRKPHFDVTRVKCTLRAVLRRHNVRVSQPPLSRERTCFFPPFLLSLPWPTRISPHARSCLGRFTRL